MSLSVTETRSELLAEARAEYARAAERKAMMTGEREQPVPVDSVLIATDPTLSEEIQAADAASSTTGGTAPAAGGPAPAGGAQVSSSSSSTSTPTISNGTGTASGSTTTATTSGSGTQNGQLVNTLA